MNQYKNYNHIRIYHQPKHPEDQEIFEIQESYVFKTHPSLGCSQEKSKYAPKSETLIQKPNNQEDYYKKQSKTKRNLLKHQDLQQKLMATHKQFPKDKFQRQEILQQQVSKLIKKNRYFQQQNTKLRDYVQFLQDYNLRLKKQLMRSIRRRNLDSSLGNMLELEQPNKQPQNQHSQFLASRNQFSHIDENKLFSTIQPQENFVSKPIFTNQRLTNQGTHRNISFGNDPVHQSHHLKSHASPFIQIDQNPIPHYYAHQKVPKNNKKINNYFPTSLQSSFLNVSNEINPQISSKQVSSQKLCPCIHNSFSLNQNITTPVSSHQNYYRSLQQTAHKVQDKKTQKKNVCPKCLKYIEVNLKSSSNKSTKNKMKNLQIYSKQDHSTKRRCVSCNEIKSNKRVNPTKSKNPKKQTPFTNIFYTNQISERMNTINQKRRKIQKTKQKILEVNPLIEI